MISQIRRFGNAAGLSEAYFFRRPHFICESQRFGVQNSFLREYRHKIFLFPHHESSDAGALLPLHDFGEQLIRFDRAARGRKKVGVFEMDRLNVIFFHEKSKIDVA